MNGIDMMLKSMGVDPEKIKQTLMAAQEQITGEISRLHTRLDKIENSLMRIQIEMDILPEEETRKYILESGTMIDELRSSFHIKPEVEENGINAN